MRILVLGGYGNFGARICRRLAAGDVEVIAAGRDPDRGHSEASFPSSIGKARLNITDADLAEKIRRLSPDIVVHCVGPFQGQDYGVALASLAAGAHYLDLADGRAFVSHFSAAIDPIAQNLGLLAVTGASTGFPHFSSAVPDSVRDRFHLDGKHTNLHRPRATRTARRSHNPSRIQLSRQAVPMA